MPTISREITSHVVPGDSVNHQLKLEAQDGPGSGGACHLYHITGFSSASNPSDPWTQRHGAPAEHSTILFQNGPIKEAGVNGVTHEVLLAILIDRMEGFQTGPFANNLNARALEYLNSALDTLQTRTRERIARGVEGTLQK